MSPKDFSQPQTISDQSKSQVSLQKSGIRKTH